MAEDRPIQQKCSAKRSTPLRSGYLLAVGLASVKMVACIGYRHRHAG